jgi:hypothetical protein
MATSEAAVAGGPQTRTASRSTSYAPLVYGLGFVVLFVVAFFMEDTPDGNASNAKWTSYFASKSHRTELIVSAFLFVVAALLLLALFTELASRVRDEARPDQSRFGLGAATIGATCIAIGGVANAVVAGAMAFGNAPEPNADVLRYGDNLGYPILAVAGMISVAVAIVVLSVQAGRVGLFSKGVVIASVVLGVLTLLSFLFFPLLAMLIWVITASIVLTRQGAAAAGA